MARDRMEPAPHLLSLPYDIRCLIYGYLFPQEPQIYTTAAQNRSGKVCLYPMHARHDLSMGTCQVSKQLNAEVAGYVYNNYLFNVVGTKKDIIAVHRRISTVMAKYARTEVRTDVLDNGPLSGTACVSIYVSGGRVERKAARRQRGNLRDLKEVESEVAMMPDLYAGWFTSGIAQRLLSNIVARRLLVVLVAVGVAIVAVCIQSVISTR